jgi:hypothetical protein
VLPSGIATDSSTKAFFRHVISTSRLRSLTSFENESFIFRDVHHSFKFCAFVIGPSFSEGNLGDKSKFVFFVRSFSQLGDDRRFFSLNSSDFELFNPNTLTCPIFRTKHDAILASKIYKNVNVLINESGSEEVNPWNVITTRGFDMAKESSLFRTRAQMEADGFALDAYTYVGEKGKKWLPLYEAKMLHQYDYRWASYAANSDEVSQVSESLKSDPSFNVLPRYWVEHDEVLSRYEKSNWTAPWVMGWRDVTNAITIRTLVATIAPAVGFGHKFLLMMPGQGSPLCLLSLLNSLVVDYVARQKVGGTSLQLFTMKQLPILDPARIPIHVTEFLEERAWQLVGVGCAMREVAASFDRPIVSFNPEERLQARCEIDAMVAYIYGLDREDLRFILDPTDLMGADYPSETFRVLKSSEIRRLGEYRTQRLVLEAWDRLFGC